MVPMTDADHAQNPQDPQDPRGDETPRPTGATGVTETPRPTGAPGPTETPRDSAAAPDGPRFELLVKQDCHLCADAITVVEEVCGRHGVPWRALDAAEHPELAERHAEEIPVLMVDGVQRDFWRIDPVRLERLLTAGRA